MPTSPPSQAGGLITALRTLTVLPVPGREAHNPAMALPWFPWAGVLIGGLTAGVAFLFGGPAGWPAGAGVAALAFNVWLTGGLHLDGLGDAVDSLHGGQTRERRLEIMKDPHLGALGMAAMALVLMVKAAALTRLAELAAWHWLPVPFVIARLVQVYLAARLPYARASGGKAAGFVQDARVWHFLAALAAALVFCVILAGWRGAVLLAVAGLPACWLGRRMGKLFGGITGDLLGAGSETIECLALWAAALLANL